MMRRLLILMFCIFAAYYTFGQSGTIRGAIKDNAGNPVANATIVLVKTDFGNISNEEGIYSITNVLSGDYLIRFSAIGYKTITQIIKVKAGGITIVNFLAEEKIEILQGVEVSGVRSITGMGYIDETHDGVIYSGKKTEVLLVDSLDANTTQNNPRQVLGRVPGANFSETEASGFPSNGIGFRGLNPTQSIETNTRQNGYNITADLYGYPETYYLPTLEAVERIEVTRGASSLQFGAQFGGVINYIVKKGSTSKPIEVTTQQTVGSFGMYNSFTSAGGQVGKFNYFGYLQYQGVQGWRPNSDYKKITGFGRLEYQATEKIKIGLEYSVLRNRIHMPGGLTDSMFHANSRASYRARNWLQSPWNILAATFDWKISQKTLVTIKSALNSSARDLVWRNEDGGPQAMDVISPVSNSYVNREVGHEGLASTTTEARLLAHYKLGGMSNTLAAGVRFYYGKMNRAGGGMGTTGSDFDLSIVGPFNYNLNFTTTNFAPFIESTFRFGEKLSITPGMRYDYIVSTEQGYTPSYDGSATIYSNSTKTRNIFLSGIGLQFKTTTSTELYGNWSQAYRPMDYSSLTPFGTIVTVDPNLKDSNGSNADFGFRGSVKNYLNFDLGGFYLQYNNRVGLLVKTDGNGIQYPFSTNVGNSIHQGLETYIEFNPVKAFFEHKQWSISFFNSLALINAKYVTGEYRGNFVAYAPSRIERFGTNLNKGRFSTTFLISTTAKSYSDARNSNSPSADAVAGVIPSYTVLDWSGTWRIKNYKIKFGVNNLADQRYFTLRTGEYPGPGIIPSIGRSFYLGIGAKF